MIRVLLDEDIDVRFRRQFGPEFHVETVAYRGWQGKKNGDLLLEAQAHFDVLISADQNLQFQQSIPKFRIGLIVLHPRRKTLEHLIELLPAVIRAVGEIGPGQTILVKPPDPGTA